MLTLPLCFQWLSSTLSLFAVNPCPPDTSDSACNGVPMLPLLCSWTGNAQASTTTSRAVGKLHTQDPNENLGSLVLPTINDPNAVDSQDVCPGYLASYVTETIHGLSATLSLAGAHCNSYSTDIDLLNLTVEYQSADRLHVLVTPSIIDDSNRTHYNTPPALLAQPVPDADAEHTGSLNDLKFVWGNKPSFWFQVIRRSTKDELFSTKGNRIVFQNQFVEIKSSLPQDYNLYGLGESFRPFRLSNDYIKTIYASDAPNQIDINSYGSWPIYYDTRYYEVDNATGDAENVSWSATRPDGNYTSSTHGVYYRNPRGMDILLQSEDVTWRTLGGNIDLYFYAGSTVEDVAKQVQVSTFGLPAMQQYFTFGYHQCRWGYNNLSDFREVVNEFEKAGLPLENIWADIDYMQLFRDFTLDTNRFDQDDFGDFLDSIHAGGIHFIPIIDSAIYHPNPENSTDAYDTYSRGHEVDVFILTADGADESGPEGFRKEYTGAVWPGYTVFPDWLSPGAQHWWTNEMTILRSRVSFDGIWIDMSEAASFCVGPCGNDHLLDNPAPGGIPKSPPTDFPEAPDSNSIDVASISASSSSQTSSFFTAAPSQGVRNINHPPYAINNVHGDLAIQAIAPNATHHDRLHTAEYDMHNLFGLQILNATYQALVAAIPEKRPFIIGRSTFAGSGTVAGHWGGDNRSKYFHMYFSIAQALSFSLFGVPMFGVDACGFAGNTDEELCSRWMQLAAFFPFYRNHNILLAVPQEPYRWPSVTAATKVAMDIRYALLPYMYTLFYSAHTTGATVMRALAWEFPNQPNLADVDNSFLLGPSIFVSPVLLPGVDTVQTVFPGAQAGTKWYEWYNRSSIIDSGALRGDNVTIPVPLGSIPVFIRGGCVLPLQPRNGQLVTREMRKQDWEVLVALDSAGAAKGSLYEDDGDSLVQNTTKHVDFVVARQALGGVLYANTRGRYEGHAGLAGVAVMGVKARPSVVQAKGDRALNTSEWDFDDGKKVLNVNGSGILASGSTGAWSQNWSISWR